MLDRWINLLSRSLHLFNSIRPRGSRRARVDFDLPRRLWQKGVILVIE